jgi:3-oxoadipate enol-lactonase
MAEQRSALVNGIRLVYQVTGSQGNPAMVLLHALGESGADWAAVTEPLAEHFLVIAPDMRGHGQSDWPRSYSFGLMYEDISGLLDHLGMETVTLVGHSMGAAVAYLLAMRQPDRVTRLIIEDAPPLYKRDRPMPGRPAGQELDFDWRVVPAILTEVNAGDQSMWDGLADIAAPTLLIGGGPRSHISQEKLAEAAARIPRCDLVTIDVGHFVHAEEPAEFTGALLGWLGLAPMSERN